MKTQALALFFFIGCAPAQLTFNSADPSSATATSKRGKQTTYVCSTSDDSYSCVPGTPQPRDEEGINQPTGTASTEVELLKVMLAAPDGCTGANEQFEKVKQAGAMADYHYFKGYCEANTNPEEACGHYQTFIKIAKYDARISSAKAFVGSSCATSDAANIKSKLANTNGCQTITEEEFSGLKASSKADYYFYKGYCARDANPGMACTYYKDFLKVAPGDGRKGQAVSFIKSQDASAHQECIIK